MYLLAVSLHHGSNQHYLGALDFELANRRAQPTFGDLVEGQVDLLIPRPGLTHLHGHQSPISAGTAEESMNW